MGIGIKLKKIRREKGISQEELAHKAEINRSYLSMVENGHSSPTMDVVQRLAEGLGVSIWLLLSDMDNKHYTYDSEHGFEIYPGLRQLLESDEDMLLINPSPEEVMLLKSIRFSGNFQPTKRFFIEALLDFRRSQRTHS